MITLLLILMLIVCQEDSLCKTAGAFGPCIKNVRHPVVKMANGKVGELITIICHCEYNDEKYVNKE